MKPRSAKPTRQTDHPQSNRRHRAASKRWAQLASILPSHVAVVITNPQGAIEYVNTRFTEITGYTATQVLGQNVRLLNSGTHSPEVFKELWETVLQGREWHGKLCNRKRNGELYWTRVTIYAAILNAVNYAAEQFLRVPSWREHIQSVIARLGRATRVSRVYIFENCRDENQHLYWRQLYEWVAAGITPQMDNPISMSSWGLIGFDDCLTEREWSAAELDALVAAANTLGAAIEREQMDQELHQRVNELEAIRQASLSLTSSLDLAAVLDAIAKSALRLMPGAQDTHIYQDQQLIFGTSLWSNGSKGQQWSSPRPNGLTYTVARIAITDPLTNIYNRRGFFQIGEGEVERARRFSHPLSVLMFDWDHLKQINDTFGHPFGDKILATLIETCRRYLRALDLLGRYGGEEFLVLLPETDLPTALQIAERIRRAVEQTPMHIEDRVIFMTISIGAATFDDKTLTLTDLVAQADQAMYRAKQAGRNRVEAYQ